MNHNLHGGMCLERGNKLDGNGLLKMKQIEAKIAAINNARSQLGLEPKGLDSLENPGKRSKSEKKYKYYHPTFNPHGKRRSELEESQEENTVTEEAQQNELAGEAIDLSFIPIPEGDAPETEAQMYNGLNLPEILDCKYAEKKNSLSKPIPDVNESLHQPIDAQQIPIPSFGWIPPPGILLLYVFSLLSKNCSFW